MKRTSQGRELIVVRSLTDSDLGLFTAHRAAAKSKQRAININASIARELLSAALFESRGTVLDCLCVLGTVRIRAPRHFGKIQKNWRLGGSKIDGTAFGQLDSKDFLLIRSVAANDGSSPVLMTFISKKTDRVVHAGIAVLVKDSLQASMALYHEGEPGFSDLDKFCPTSLLGIRS